MEKTTRSYRRLRERSNRRPPRPRGAPNPLRKRLRAEIEFLRVALGPRCNPAGVDAETVLRELERLLRLVA